MAKFARKRKVERIRLAFPLLARIGTMDAVVLDVSLHGCRLEHATPLRVGSKVRLMFRWEDEEVEATCRVVRCNLDTFSVGTNGLTVYHSGVEFEETGLNAIPIIRKLIGMQIMRALDEQRSNARGDIPTYMKHMAIFSEGMLTANQSEVAEIYEGHTSIPQVRIARERGYVSYSLEANRWKILRTREASQPPEGFTVWAYEDQEELTLLCKAYEKGDEAFRTLIRLCAEVSTVVDDSIPPQKFNP